MRQILNTLWASFRSRFTQIWTRVRLWTSLSYWRTKGLSNVRNFFGKLFNVKPRDRGDYYPVFRWLISKKLAFSLVVAVGVVSLYYIVIMSPVSAKAGTQSGEVAVRSYTYNSLPLKYYSGTVQILSRDKQVAYVGEVADGYAAGTGTLYDEEGKLLYEGKFEQSMFSGEGKLYYPNGAVQYQGMFSKNLYDGRGECFRTSGVLEYSGEYAGGLRSGNGTLYDAGGNQIFSGSFTQDHLIYSEFLSKTTSEAAGMYSGAQAIYSGVGEHCVAMKEIRAVYEAADGSNALDEEWRIRRIYVLEDSLLYNGEIIRTMDDLTGYFGEPEYYGTTWVTLAEAVSINLLGDGDVFGTVDIRTAGTFDEVYTVQGYDRDFSVYIYTYRVDDLLYTFYANSGGTSGFTLYSVEIV